MEIGMTIGDSIDRIGQTTARFPFAELAIGEGDRRIDDVDTDRLEGLLATHDNDLLVHLPFKQPLGTTVATIDEATVAYHRRLLEWAGDHGARKAVLHGTARDPNRTAYREAARTTITAIAAAGDAAGVEVCVENVGQLRQGLALDRLGTIAAEADVSLCFDVGHAYLEAGASGSEEFIAQYGDHISHLHIHDARRRGDTHVPLGSGNVDLAAIAAQFNKFDGTAGIEVFTDDTELLRDTARRTAAAFGTEPAPPDR
jgi:Sugar phosphate isomerases/epimerases